ncbi:MAG: hypothetical protein H6641_18360 [Caldilineaceae bacterium]|nr:hypothetical protein [Caldilineaceae bacterium]
MRQLLIVFLILLTLLVFFAVVSDTPRRSGVPVLHSAASDTVANNVDVIDSVPEYAEKVSPYMEVVSVEIEAMSLMVLYPMFGNEKWLSSASKIAGIFAKAFDQATAIRVSSQLSGAHRKLVGGLLDCKNGSRRFEAAARAGDMAAMDRAIAPMETCVTKLQIAASTLEAINGQ